MEDSLGRIQEIREIMVLHSTYHKPIFSAREWNGRANCADGEKIVIPRRTSPHSAIGVSPAVALMGRQLATRLPFVREQLSLLQQRDVDMRYSDQHAKTMYK